MKRAWVLFVAAAGILSVTLGADDRAGAFDPALRPARSGGDRCGPDWTLAADLRGGRHGQGRNRQHGFSEADGNGHLGGREGRRPRAKRGGAADHRRAPGERPAAAGAGGFRRSPPGRAGRSGGGRGRSGRRCACGRHPSALPDDARPGIGQPPGIRRGRCPLPPGAGRARPIGRDAEAAGQRARQEAALAAARVSAADAAPTAAFDGIVTAKMVDPGDLAVPGKPLLSLEKAGAHRVDLRLPEAYVLGATRPRRFQSASKARRPLRWRGSSTSWRRRPIPAADRFSCRFACRPPQTCVPGCSRGWG